MNKSKTREQIHALVLMALLVAVEVVLTRFLSIRTPIVTIGFGFIPVCLAAMMFGPVRAGIVGAMSDFLGAMLFPIGAYFPGFTVTALLAGMVYGFFFRSRPLKLIHIVLAVVLVQVVLNLGLSTFWLHMITGKGVLALLPARLIKCAFMIPVEIVALQIINKSVGAKLASSVRLA